MNILGAALSGMAAAEARLNVSASNVANAQSTGALPQPAGASSAPQPYRPLVLIQFGLADGGVATETRPSPDGVIATYDPEAPFADAKGLVAAPDVDMAAEAVSQIQALQQFKANLRIIETEDQMLKASLSLKA